jgi:hypothetical protein
MSVIQALRRLRLGGLRFEASLGKEFMKFPFSKITRGKWTRDVAQGVESLL